MLPPFRTVHDAGALARRLRAVALAIGLAVGAVSAAATPLGPLTAQSLRGEPLRAVLTLGPAAAPDATGGVRIAPASAYERLGFVRDPVLAGATLRATTEPDGRRFLRIDTEAPVVTAELVLLLEDGASRRLYRLRLGSDEPADRVNVRGVEPVARIAEAALPGSGSAGGDAPARIATAGVREARPEPRSAGVGDGRGAAAAETASAGVPATPIGPQGRPDALTVAEGADLESLARTLRPPGATLEQTAAALLRANRAAFVGRPPRPIVGALLQVPSEAAVLAIPPADARTVLAALSADGASDGPGASTADARAAGGSAPSGREPRAPGRAASPTAATANASATGSGAAGAPPTSRTVTASAGTAAGAPSPAPARAAPARGDGDASFRADVEALNRRIAGLERRVAALRDGLVANADREESLLRELIDATRRGAAARVAAAPPR